MSDTTSEFVQKLLTLVAKTGTGQVHSDAISKLVNGFVRSIDVEKKAEKKAKKDAKKDAKKNGKKEKSDTDKPHNVYIRYCIEKRKSIADLPENKGKRPDAITSIVAEEWRKDRAQNSPFIAKLQQQADEASLKYKKAKEEAKAKAKEADAKDEKEPSTPLKKEKAPKAPKAPKKKKVEKDENEEKADKASKKKTALDFSEQ